jgi:hypothetical protein
MIGHGLGGPFAAAVERPLMVVEAGLAPRRFRMRRRRMVFTVLIRKILLEQCLGNCHDTVMERRYRVCA